MAVGETMDLINAGTFLTGRFQVRAHRRLLCSGAQQQSDGRFIIDVQTLQRWLDDPAFQFLCANSHIRPLWLGRLPWRLDGVNRATGCITTLE